MNEIIVSLTSYPERMHKVENVIKKMAKQTVKPDKIVLYLAEEQFEKKILPFESEKCGNAGFEVHWVEKNLGPHTKYYYALQEYKDDIVITVDDDIFYLDTVVEELMQYHEKFPNAVLARRAHRITFLSKDEVAPYQKWDYECGDYVGEPRMDFCATGVGGVLYPPHVFGEELFNRECFQRLCPYADDLWLKVIEVYYNIPVVLVKEQYEDQEDKSISLKGLSSSVNRMGNDIQLAALLKAYPLTSDGTEKLLERIKSTEYILLDDLVKIRIERATKVFKKMILHKKILIYGAGIVAKRVYRFIFDISMKDNMESFIVDDVSVNPDELYEVPVRDWRGYIDTKLPIIIALAKPLDEEVKNILLTNGIDESRIIMIDRQVYKGLKYMYTQE